MTSNTVHRPSRRSVVTAGAAVAAASVLGTAARAQPLQKIKAVFPARSAVSWPMFLAKEGGHYEQHGLDVELRFGVHPVGMAGLVSGEIQFTNPSIDQIAAAAVKDPILVSMASMLNKGTFALMARPQITSVQALKGKRFGTGRVGDPPYHYAVGLLKEFGLKANDVQWVPTGADANTRAAMLTAGAIDAVLLTSPAWFVLEAQGMRPLAQLEDHDVVVCTVYTFRRSWLAANPTVPERIIKAQVEAIKRFYEDRQFAIDTYLKYDRVDGAAVTRLYDDYKNKNLFDRVPLVARASADTAIERISDDIPAARNLDMQKVMDMSVVRRLIAEGYFEKLFGPGIKAEQDRKLQSTFR